MESGNSLVVDYLKWLTTQAGEPSTRQIAKMAKVSHTTVATALRHGRGSLGALLAIVTALGGDETEFKVLLKTADQSQQPRWKSELEQARREEADFRQRLLGELTAIRKLLEGGRHD